VAEDVEGEALSTPGGQLDPQDGQGRRGQVAVLRRPPQGVHGRPGRRHRRHGDQPRGRAEAVRGRAWTCSARCAARRSRRTPPTLVEGGGHADDVEGRIAQIKREIEDSDSDWDREKLQERLAKLSGGVAVIKVGAATETALKERKHRIEDAVSATRAAVEEGIVPGGGSALVQAAKSLEDNLGLTGDEATGVSVVRKALSAPLHWIAANGGLEGAVVVGKVADQEWGHGFNAATLTYGDLMADGVIDPVKVTAPPSSTPRRSRGWCSPPRAPWWTSPSRRLRPPPRGTARARALSRRNGPKDG
jgi:hypothetical protein